ncbi:hypothetical protein B0J11DRAFT_124257 [Dendryphion nanum]|uniref:polynucleotide adenylyltransferase n=1 Tax=Dendryphion nanum TaxID=256645 RepID=A0A9P9D9Z4_9PLEO|nr:hypothetical protein B0J11DRAFT_124257 [Dendryphion nanum]
MGESSTASTASTHIYTPHNSATHSKEHQNGFDSVAWNSSPVPVAPSLFALSQQHHTSASHSQSPQHCPPYLVLHPLLQLANLHSTAAAAALSAPQCPTVIVSPHYQSPTAERGSNSAAAVKNNFTKPTPVRQKPDGNNGTLQGVQRSAPMTPSGVPNMVGKQEDKATLPRNQRPSIVSQHSNSVPSTPLQLARQYESHSRSPSPNGGLGSHSPRSVSSEANGAMPTLRAAKPGQPCKYETNHAFGRRRMPYTSSDILEKAKEEPKKSLDPQEDEKLSGDMRTLYDRLLPTQESTDRRQAFVKKLENILHTEWPGTEFKVHVFGSSGNDLYTNDSDVDICIQTPMKRLEEMHLLAATLDKYGMEKVVCVPQAKVRIVKVWDPDLKLACDMNVNNTLALENTRMIKTYVQIDERVRPLAMILKHWTKQRILNDAAVGGTISSYTWICMILNFLQTREPPIIPSLHKLRGDQTDIPCSSDFVDDLDKLKGFGIKNEESLGQLLFQFFRCYGHEIDFERSVVSVREGRLLSREEKNWQKRSLTKEARNRLCVEEPFNTARNLGNSADDFAWRGIHLEIRRAFDLLADNQQLEKACEQFEYPPEERSTIFKKPTSSVKTVLQTPGSRGGRGGSNHRGRGGFKNQNGHGYGRRSSSSTSYGANRAPFLNSPPIGTMPGQEYFSRGLNEQLHDQLYQQYQMLEMQSNTLRAQLAAQQRVQQAHQAHQAHHAQAVHHAHAQAIAHAQAHAQAQAQAQAHSRGQSSTNGSPQKSPYINGRSSPRMQDLGMPANAIPQFIYQYPGFFDPTQTSSQAPQDGPRTNPSSPSLTHSVPGLRRGVHRSSNASDTGSIRSQSQPPRGGQNQPALPGYTSIPQFYDPTTFAGYPIARSNQEMPPSQPTSDAPFSPMSQYTETAVSSDHSTPKEYVGYYVAEDPQIPIQAPDYSVQQIPSFNELIQRRRRVSPEITQPLLNTALRRVSRSPSPLGGHMRSYSAIGVPPGDTETQTRKERIDSTRPPIDNGPVIVNGSFPPQPKESRNRSGTIDGLAPLDIGNSTALGIYTNNFETQHLAPVEQRHHYPQDRTQYRNGSDVVKSKMANGYSQSPTTVEVNGLARVSSAGQQSFSAGPETWVNYDSTNSDKSSPSTSISPTRTQPQQWRSVGYTNGLSPLDTLNAPHPPPQEVKSASLPLLSPVFETRTPSPTANRQLESKKLNGMKPQAKENQSQSQQQQQQQQQQPRRASHTQAHSAKDSGRSNQQKGNPQTGDKGTKAHVGASNNNNNSNSNNNNNNNSWQQPSSRRTGKKKTKQKSVAEPKTTGEPLPANSADRKGG